MPFIVKCCLIDVRQPLSCLLWNLVLRLMFAKVMRSSETVDQMKPKMDISEKVDKKVLHKRLVHKIRAQDMVEAY